MASEDAAAGSGELVWPEGWTARPAPLRTTTRQAMGAVAGFLVAAGVAMAITESGGEWAAWLGGPGPWFLPVAILLLVLGTLWLVSDRDVRERFEQVPGPNGSDGSEGSSEWALVFGYTRLATGIWLMSSGVAGGLIATAVGTLVSTAVGVPVVVVLLAAGPAVVLLQGRVGAGPPRVELTESRLVWRQGRTMLAVPWAQVTRVRAVEFRQRSDSQDIRVPRLGVYVSDAAPITAGPRRGQGPVARLAGRADPAGRAARQVGTDLAIPVVGLTTSPTRLYWAAVAFRDPARRTALLDGAELTPDPPA